MSVRVIPPFLKPGDKIAIAATARKVSKAEMQPAIDIFTGWGLEVVIHPDLFAEENQFAGSDSLRASVFQSYLNDTSIKAIICARGGYGTVRMIDLLDWSSFDKQPKWVIGYSDVTVLHSHIHKHTNVCSLHATMPINMQQPEATAWSINAMHKEGKLETTLDSTKLSKNYIKAICDGLLKIFSKMGISTLQSYHGSQVFEILGINKDVVKKYFTGGISRIEGMSLDDLAREALMKHVTGFAGENSNQHLLNEGGIYQWKRRGEAHLFNPETVHLLQQATRTNSYEVYKKYAKVINEQTDKLYTIRGLLCFAHHREAISIDEVEPAENIMKRFATGAMSFGSISHEAHSTLAIAMNRIGAKSNTGEGGEDEMRYEIMPNGDSMRSAIKQIASARFGVTINYLTNADELQIKMAQGAKPGEGGQLPGHKVDDWIAKTRHSTPGVGLISPPPHHDIYSIEDL
ncbi:MAG: hypothetical protein EAY81_05670, partial [Bacteroidetes bacterium]